MLGQSTTGNNKKNSKKEIEDLVSNCLDKKRNDIPPFIKHLHKKRGWYYCTCYAYINLFHLTLLTLPYNVGNQVSESVLRSKIISLEDKIQSQELLIKKLQNQLRSTNANKSLTISQGEVHDEEAVLLTCGKIKELLVAQHNARCCNFCGQQSESVVIEKRTGRFVANFICKLCDRKVWEWTSSVNWNDGAGGVNRKFAQGATASGINHWQYKRLCQYVNLRSMRRCITRPTRQAERWSDRLLRQTC